MSSNLVNIQLTGKITPAPIQKKPKNKKVAQPLPKGKQKKKQNQPFSIYKKKKKEAMNFLLNSNNTAAQLFVTPYQNQPTTSNQLIPPEQNGFNYFPQPNLTPNMQQSYCPIPGFQQNMIGQNAQLVPQLPTTGLGRKARRKLIRIQNIIQTAVTIVDPTERAQIASEMSKIWQLNSIDEKYKKLVAFYETLPDKWRFFQDNPTGLKKRNIVITPTTQTKTEYSAPPVMIPAQSLQKQQDQPPQVVKPNPIPARGKKTKKTVIQNVQVFNIYKSGQNSQVPSQFQAPHQDEPEDLSDDLAPHIGQQTSAAQPLPVTAENKLNFKFQRTTQQKTSDWSEYQNKFKQIGGASPDHEDDSQEVKQELNKSVNTGFSTPQTPYSSQPTATQTLATLQQATVKADIKFQKSTDIPLKPIDVRVRTPGPGIQQPNLPRESYPKGIPKSFLSQESNPVPPQPMPGYSMPAGIPRSFLVQEQRLPEMQPTVPTQVQIPPGPYPPGQQAGFMELPSWILPAPAPAPPPPAGQLTRPYSPTDVYSEGQRDDEFREGSESPDLLQSNQKRQSAFSRLGPLTQPKKPKLTINLQLNKDQAVREVVDETDESFRYVPVHLRKDILESEDEVVKKYLPFWPWKKTLQLRKTVSARLSKSVMLLEQEQMEAGYEKDSVFIQLVVTGYPVTWTKEDVLDAVLECVKGKSFIPLFIEFSSQKCRFLVIRCQPALIAIHKVGFCIRKDDVELTLSISLTDMSLNQIDLIPRLVLRRRLMLMSDEHNVDLTEFLIEKDVSHFIYFPLNRLTNQIELIQLQSAVTWEYITELNLSKNRLTSIDGFDLLKNTPRLKRLDLSHNCLDKVTLLLSIRGLPLRSLRLEGNPLCRDYIDPEHYIKVVRMMFAEVMELDGVRITLKGDLPLMRRNYCPEAAASVVEKFLETFFPLLEAAYDDRAAIEDLYDKEAVLTITFRYKLRYGTAFRYFRNLFLRARSLEEKDMETVVGAAAITSLVCKWPDIEHDRYSITVDVLHHDDFTTIVRLGGVLKLTAKSLAEDEHLLTFSRIVVLHTKTGAEYKVMNEMLYWDVPRDEVTRTAFNVTTVRPKQLSLKLESPPDDELKSKLTDIFVKIADIDKKRGARCLELKNWDLRSALEYYVTLLKIDDLAPLSSPKDSTPAPHAS